MAISFIQGVGNGSNAATSFTITLTNTVTGNFIWVGIASGLGTVTSVTDGTNTFTAGVADYNYNASNHMIWYYAKNITGAASHVITVNLSGSLSVDGIAREYSGIDTNAPTDQTAQNTGSSSTPSSGATSTTTQASELVIGFFGCGSSVTETLGSGFSNLTVATVSASASAAAEDLIVSSTGTQTATFGTSTIFNWGCQVATFKGASSKPSFRPNNLRPHAFSPGIAR